MATIERKRKRPNVFGRAALEVGLVDGDEDIPVFGPVPKSKVMAIARAAIEGRRKPDSCVLLNYNAADLAEILERAQSKK